MCQSTYDYCGPVVGPDGQMCDFRARRGSILAGMPGEVVSGQGMLEAGGGATSSASVPNRPKLAMEAGLATEGILVTERDYVSQPRIARPYEMAGRGGVPRAAAMHVRRAVRPQEQQGLPIRR